MYLLDTNIVSDLRRPERANDGVLRWVGSTDVDSMYVSALTLMEIHIGVLRAERRDAAAGRVLRQWLDERVVPSFAGRVLAIDGPVALLCARLHVPDARPERDALIAATALVHGFTVVTRNTGDFAATAVPLLNPWT
ncbi:type II toxin-antitoxin system VapC family toxin [Caenispirillum bisanense]|uniref:type II toxin-antitoxin system VapC family toxin n=1 Tax=Caenispirillum bisanense TaxID=414052 RepID=UPI0031D23C65